MRADIRNKLFLFYAINCSFFSKLGKRALWLMFDVDPTIENCFIKLPQPSESLFTGQADSFLVHSSLKPGRINGRNYRSVSGNLRREPRSASEAASPLRSSSWRSCTWYVQRCPGDTRGT